MSSGSSPRTPGSQSSRYSLYKSPSDRKHALRNVLTRAQNLHQNTDTDALDTLDEVFREVDGIHDDETLDEKVGHQDQIVMDSEVMSVSSKVIQTCTQSLTKECSSFSQADFVEKLMTFVQNLPDTTLAEPNWSILRDEIAYINTTASYTCLLDWMNLSNQPAIVKSKKERKTLGQNREAQTAVLRPENVVQMEEEEKAIEKTVQKIRKLVSREYKSNSTPIDFFELILDPTDFGKTIENLLHVSFLIRDGHLKLSINDDGTPLITPTNKEMFNRAREMGENDKFQNILTLDPEQWRMLNNVYRLEKPMIDF